MHALFWKGFVHIYLHVFILSFSNKSFTCIKKKHILLFLIHGQMIQNMLKFYCLFEDQSD